MTRSSPSTLVGAASGCASASGTEGGCGRDDFALIQSGLGAGVWALGSSVRCGRSRLAPAPA
eukprot:scaffold8870_cov122-Isochrysis_galbana.AAC.2